MSPAYGHALLRGHAEIQTAAGISQSAGGFQSPPRDAWLGCLDEFSDYLTQGGLFDDLKAHLADLCRDLALGEIRWVTYGP